MYASEDRPIRDRGARLRLAALGQFGVTWLAGGEIGLEKGLLQPLNPDCQAGWRRLSVAEGLPLARKGPSQRGQQHPLLGHLHQHHRGAPPRHRGAAPARRRSRAVLHLGPRRASQQLQAGSTLLLVASCCDLWRTLAARTEARLCCGHDVHG